jgi:hypothetical protein
LSSLPFSAPWRHYLRQEPYAVAPHVRIWAGGAGQPASLPRPSIPFIRKCINLELFRKSFPLLDFVKIMIFKKSLIKLKSYNDVNSLALKMLFNNNGLDQLMDRRMVGFQNTV